MRTEPKSIDEIHRAGFNIKPVHKGADSIINGIDILNGNTEYNITYDTSNKGNLKIKIPLKFYFCKDIGLSIPMINLLYTKGIIKFKNFEPFCSTQVSPFNSQNTFLSKFY
mgnify:CR=1 FL=1